MGHVQIITLSEARCPQCNKLLARNFDGHADLMCSRCKVEVRFESTGDRTLLDKRRE